MEKKRINLLELWKKVDLSKPSNILLIISNFAVILFAIIDNFSALEVLWIYWIQSVIIGLFNFVNILSLKEFTTEGLKRGNKPVGASESAKIGSAFFFLLHYGFFHLIYAMFLGGFNSIGIGSSSSLGNNFLYLTAFTFFISYLIEFINVKKNSADKIPNLGLLMFTPYIRIIPMHLTIILGGFIATAGSFFSMDTNLGIIILFTIIKSFVDLLTHSIDFE